MIRGLLIAFMLFGQAAYAQAPDGPSPRQQTPRARPEQPQEPEGGVPVDAGGQAAVDPTKNVLDLVEAESKYQDAQRNSEAAEARALLDAAKELNKELRTADNHFQDEMRKAESKRLDDLRAALTLRADDLRDADEQFADANISALSEQARTRASYEALLRETETKRVNDILEVTATALTTATNQANETATALALRVQQSAEVISAQVDTAASVATAALDRVEERVATAQVALEARISALETYQNQGVGRSAFVDPQITSLNETVQRLIEAQSASTGQDQGTSGTIGWILGAIGALGVLFGIFMAVSGRRPERERATQ